MFKKAISIGVTAALLGSLMVALVPGVAFGVSWTTSPTPIPTVARGTEAGAASLAITENSVCEFSGGNRIDIWIRDKDGGNTVFFGAGGAVGPDSLAPTLTHDPNDDSHLWVRIGTANCSQLETLTLTGLTIYADGDTAPPGNPWFPNPDSDNAALGNIQVLYGLSDNAANWVVDKTIRSATGTLVNDEESPTDRHRDQQHQPGRGTAGRLRHYRHRRVHQLRPGVLRRSERGEEGRRRGGRRAGQPAHPPCPGHRL